MLLPLAGVAAVREVHDDARHDHEPDRTRVARDHLDRSERDARVARGNGQREDDVTDRRAPRETPLRQRDRGLHEKAGQHG